MKKLWRMTTPFAITGLLCGCASIIHGSRQDIKVTSDPSGAVVRVNLNNAATTTPGVLTLNRKEIGYVLTFEKEGTLRETAEGRPAGGG